MSLDPISSGLNLIGQFLGVAKPLLDQHLAQQYDNEFIETCHQIQTACHLNDPARADELHALCDKLCVDNGQTAGGLGDSFVRVRVSNVAALLTIAAGATCNRKKFAAALAKLEK